jgi:predicted nucleotidyltransferase component of viral defense system
MTILYDPKDRGFGDAMSAIDRCQIAMVRELAHTTDGRLILKGGMAMRMAVGSMRLTKDVDFDRADGVSTAAVQSSVKRALQYAAQSAGLRGAEVDPGKTTETTVRMRLVGTLAGAPVRFVVEVSGRNPVPRDCQARVQVAPPARYGIAPFVISTYSHAMLATSKILAVMSVNRNVPRDVYDLNDLLTVDPVALIAQRIRPADLLQIQEGVLTKVCAIDFDLAHQELVPYIPPDQRDALDQARWEEMTLNVAQAIQQWVAHALQRGPGPAPQP